MTTSTTPAVAGPEVTWAPVARVNLLPREIDEGRRFQRLQRVLAGAVVLTVLAVAGLYYQEMQSVADARAALEETEGRNATLQGQQALYQEVPKVTAELKAASTARASVLAGDVVYNRLLDDIVRARPSGLSVESMDIAPTVTGEATAATGTTGTTTGTDTTAAATGTAGTTTTATTAGQVGSLAITGQAKDLGQVGTWMTTLGDVAGLASVQLISASGAGADGTSYSINASITSDALSHRYDVEAP